MPCLVKETPILSTPPYGSPEGLFEVTDIKGDVIKSLKVSYVNEISIDFRDTCHEIYLCRLSIGEGCRIINFYKLP